MQKTTRLFCLAALALAVQACHTPHHGSGSSASAPFTLIEAHSQNWTAGREEGGRGTDYYFKVALHADNVSFDSIWVDNKVLPVFIAKEGNTVSSKPITYTNGDTIILRGSATAASPAATQPAGYSGAAVVRYWLNSKPAYYSIKQVEKKESLNLPTRN